MDRLKCNGFLLESPFPEVSEQSVKWGEGHILKLANMHKAIVDINTGKVFSIVSKDYKLIRHEEAIEEVEKAIESHVDFGRYDVSTEFYNDGGRMRRTYRFPEITVNITPHDAVNLELHLFNSYDTTWPFIVILGAFRLVCSNGLVVGKKFFHFRRRHVFDLAEVALLNNLSESICQFRKQGQSWQRLTSIPLTKEVYVKVMETMKLGKNAVEAIQDEAQKSVSLSEEGMPLATLWFFYNLLTWYVSFRAVSLNHRVEMENRLRAAMKYLKAGRYTTHKLAERRS
jgi:hypothetical protein